MVPTQKGYQKGIFGKTMEPRGSDYLTPRQAARLLNVSVSTVYKWGPDRKHGGRLPFYRFGAEKGTVRFRKEDLEAFARACRVEVRR